MKKLFTLAVLSVVLAMTAGMLFAEDVVTWKFIEVELSPLGVQDKDVDLFYSVSMSAEGSQWIESGGYTALELQPLLKYFDISSPEELTGKTFQSPEADAYSALDLFVIQIKCNFNYKAPTDEEIYDRAAKALAKMELPDYSDVAKKDVFRAFSKAFDGFNSRPEWFSVFNSKIGKFSNRKVQLKEADYEKFNVRIKGPAEYLLLVSLETGEERRVILGPYSTPISFDSEE